MLQQHKKKHRKWFASATPPLHKVLNMSISKSVSNRARNLIKAEQLNEREFVAWGGSEPHHVNYYEGVWTCDCNPYRLDHATCSHIIRAAMVLNGLVSSDKYEG